MKKAGWTGKIWPKSNVSAKGAFIPAWMVKQNHLKLPPGGTSCKSVRRTPRSFRDGWRDRHIGMNAPPWSMTRSPPTNSFRCSGIGAGRFEGRHHLFRGNDRRIIGHGVDFASPAPTAGDLFYAFQPVQGGLANIVSVDVKRYFGQGGGRHGQK